MKIRVNYNDFTEQYFNSVEDAKSDVFRRFVEDDVQPDNIVEENVEGNEIAVYAPEWSLELHRIENECPDNMSEAQLS